MCFFCFVVIHCAALWPVMLCVNVLSELNWLTYYRKQENGNSFSVDWTHIKSHDLLPACRSTPTMVRGIIFFCPSGLQQTQDTTPVERRRSAQNVSVLVTLTYAEGDRDNGRKNTFAFHIEDFHVEPSLPQRQRLWSSSAFIKYNIVTFTEKKTHCFNYCSWSGICAWLCGCTQLSVIIMFISTEIKGFHFPCMSTSDGRFVFCSWEKGECQKHLPNLYYWHAVTRKWLLRDSPGWVR